MADLIVTCTTGEASLTASTAKTLITVGAPTNQRLKLRGFSVMGKSGSSSDTPVKVELIQCASITGGTAGSVTTKSRDTDYGETIQATYAGNYSVEPTFNTSTTIETFEFQPQTGLVIMFPTGLEYKLKGGQTWGFRLTPGAQAETVVLNTYIEE